MGATITSSLNTSWILDIQLKHQPNPLMLLSEGCVDCHKRVMTGVVSAVET